MEKNIFRLIYVLLILCLCLICVSCKDVEDQNVKSENSDDTKYEVEDSDVDIYVSDREDAILCETDEYIIQRKSGVCILDFKNGNQKDKISTGGCVVYTECIFFDTFDEMKNAILNGTFNEDQLFTMRNFFPRTENNNILIVDPMDITIPKIPKGSSSKHSSINLYGQNYSWEIKYYQRDYAQSSWSGGYDWYFFGFLSNSEFSKELKNYTDFEANLEQSQYCEIISKTQEDESGATLYRYYDHGETHKAWQYSVETDDMKIYVVESFSERETSNPGGYIEIYGTDANGCFKVTGYCHSRPSVEWLTEWGTRRKIG